jgi:alpha-N-acetylglucosamine transferase
MDYILTPIKRIITFLLGKTKPKSNELIEVDPIKEDEVDPIKEDEVDPIKEDEVDPIKEDEVDPIKEDEVIEEIKETY